MKKVRMLLMIAIVMLFLDGFTLNTEVESIHIESDFSNVNTKLIANFDTEKPVIKHETIIVGNTPLTKEMEIEEEIIEEKNNQKKYTEEELDILSHLIMGEAEGESWEHKIYVGSVVLNRIKDERFPNTLKDVVFQNNPIQYACTVDGNYYKEPNEESIEVAKYLLENGSQIPEYIIFQAQFKQGDSTYKKIGNTYFCYWKEDIG